MTDSVDFLPFICNPFDVGVWGIFEVGPSLRLGFLPRLATGFGLAGPGLAATCFTGNALPVVGARVIDLCAGTVSLIVF